MPGCKPQAQLLPTAEIGTAQQEIPVANLTASFTFQVSKHELLLIRQAVAELSHAYDSVDADRDGVEPDLKAIQICNNLVSTIDQTLDRRFNH
jgi:hypothetical protein